MENINNKSNINSQEQEIDMVDLLKKLWNDRKLVFKSCGWAIFVGLIVGFSIPKEYTTTVTLAPETTGGNKPVGGLSALASMAGINVGGTQSADALSPTLYPDIVKSIPFAVEILDVKVNDIDRELNATVYDYMKDHQEKAWWSYLISAPFKAMGWIINTIKGNEETEENEINPYRLTKKQKEIIDALTERITVEQDEKTLVITLSVTMQDPLISANLTDTVMVKLQQYITEYRTNKAKKDLEFTEKLYNESMENYHRLQQEYADYMDKNQGITMNKAKVQQERMRNEADLAFNVYNQTAQQLQIAKAKVQEVTPVYTVVQAPTVPIKASKPSKPMILIGFVFLAGVASCGWILLGKDLVESFKNK